jgi:outer membrane lipoprotein-sorting protein
MNLKLVRSSLFHHAFTVAALLAFWCCGPKTLAAAGADAFLDDWLRVQTSLRSWSADFSQTRQLKTLKQPLVSQGRVWFSAPIFFRWELGNPPQTIAVRQPEQLLVIYPRLRRAERYPIEGTAAGPWKDALALLEAGFPQSRAELLDRFQITAQNETAARVSLTMAPRAAAARRMMPRIQLEIDRASLLLVATEIEFADGSIMRNDFTNIIVNPPLAGDLFTPVIDPSFRIVEPAP